MNDIEKHKIRKNGGYTPEDTLNAAKRVLDEAEDVVVVVKTKEGLIHRFNTPMDNIYLAGLLEATKIFEFMDN